MKSSHSPTMYSCLLGETELSRSRMLTTRTSRVPTMPTDGLKCSIVGETIATPFDLVRDEPREELREKAEECFKKQLEQGEPTPGHRSIDLLQAGHVDKLTYWATYYRRLHARRRPSIDTGSGRELLA